MNKIIVNQYPNQNYSTIFNQQTGMFIRIENEGAPEPFWCEYGPELMDVSITNWCDRECRYCYKGSNTTDSHMSLENYTRIVQEASQIKVSQIALGGGNPNQHPQFCEILRITSHYGIIPSYTTNGRGLSKSILETTKRYCGAVAVSAYEPYTEMEDAIHKLIDYNVKTNIHFLLTSQSINNMISWLKEPPEFLNDINAIIFLNYKPTGRYPSPDLLANKDKKTKMFFDLLRNQFNFKIGFDSCSITGITQYLDINPIFVESCEAGRFSLYISEDMMMYPCSFMSGIIEGIDLAKYKIQEVWRNSSMFKNFRQIMKSTECQSCKHSKLCMGGCPIFPEINFCEKRF